VFDSDLLARYYENATLFAKPEVHDISQHGQRTRATATDNMHRKFGEDRPFGFRVMSADRQTD